MSEKAWPPPDFPLVDGDYAMTDSWLVQLPAQFCRRIEDGSLVLWRPGVTAWTTIWNLDGIPPAERLESIKQTASPERFEERHRVDGAVTYYQYRLVDTNEQGDLNSFYVFALTERQYVQLSVYFDGAEDEVLARQFIAGLTYTGK